MDLGSTKNHKIVSSASFRPIPLPCASNCSCDSQTFNPVCGSDGVNYFTPCHAGCITETVSNVTNKKVHFKSPNVMTLNTRNSCLEFCNPNLLNIFFYCKNSIKIIARRLKQNLDYGGLSNYLNFKRNNINGNFSIGSQQEGQQ